MSWTLRDLLLKGAPWEVLPEDRPRVERAARRYAGDPTLGKRDRDYIGRVWLPREEPDPEPVAFVFPDKGDCASCGAECRSECRGTAA